MIAEISTRFSNFTFVLVCYITNHLMRTGPLGNSEFCFPRISVFPETKSRETLRFESLSVKYLIDSSNRECETSVVLRVLPNVDVNG